MKNVQRARLGREMTVIRHPGGGTGESEEQDHPGRWLTRKGTCQAWQPE